MSRIQPLNDIKRSHIKEVMRHAKGDMDLASQILGVTIDDLRQLLISHGLDKVQEPSASPATHEEE